MRKRVRLSTLRFAVALLVLLLVVVMQQVQIAGMRQLIDPCAKQRDLFTTTIREQRDQIERQRE
jgi:hypothetical protein